MVRTDFNADCFVTADGLGLVPPSPDNQNKRSTRGVGRDFTFQERKMSTKKINICKIRKGQPKSIKVGMAGNVLLTY